MAIAITDNSKAVAATPLTKYDFRSPGKMAREQVRSLELAHETFARRWGSVLTNALRAVVHLELAAVQQLTYEDYVRSMPNPVVLGVVSLEPLPGGALIELDVPMGLSMVDRMLGGPGRPLGVRRPTELESALLRELLESASGSVGETLAPFVEVDPELTGLEFNPHMVQTISPSEMVLVFTYSLAVAHGSRSDGLVTVCYPFSLLQPAAERLGRAGWGDRPELSASSEDATKGPLRSHVEDLVVDMTVTLKPSSLPAEDLAGMACGDVLRLDHRTDEPALVRLGGAEVMQARAGRRGRRRAIQILRWSE